MGASTLTVQNGILGILGILQELTITTDNELHTHELIIYSGNDVMSLVLSGLVVEFIPPIEWAHNNKNGDKITIVFNLITKLNGVLVGNSFKKAEYIIPSPINPSCTISYADVAGYSNTFGGLIQGMSTIDVTITPTTIYDSPISAIISSVDDKTYYGEQFIAGLSSSGVVPIHSTVIDKRGKSGISTTNLLVLPYSKPIVFKLTGTRCDDQGNYNILGSWVKVDLETQISTLDDKNKMSYWLLYKKSNDTDWETLDIFMPISIYDKTASYLFEADTDSSYDIRILLSDELTTTEVSTQAPTAFSIININANGNGLGIGKKAEYDNVLDIGIRSRFVGGFIRPTIPDNEDFDNLRTPNVYIMRNIGTVSNRRYISNPLNELPLEDVTGTLYVEACGNAGQIHQTVVLCSKTNPIRFERFYYESSWGDWLITYNNN